MNQFLLLLWKNYKLQKRSLIGTLLEIAVPALFAIILMPIRRIVKSIQYPDDTMFRAFNVEQFDGGLTPKETYFSRFHVDAAPPYNSVSYESSKFQQTQFWTFGYAPNSSTLINAMMAQVADQLIMKVIGFGSETAMVDYLMANEALCLGGVSFLNDTFKNFTYKLRFSHSPRNDPSTSLFRTDYDWKTNLIFPLFPVLGPRENRSLEGGDPGYFREGFLQVQKAIDFALISSQNASIDKLDLKLKRFPYPPYNDDKFVVVIQAIFPFIIMLSFVFTVILTAKAIVYEKETGIKEAMKLMGMKPWVYWISWYVKTFLLLLPSLIFMIITFKVKLSLTSGGEASIIDKTDPILFTIFMFLYASTTITFTFLCTTFFKKANSAAAGAGVIWFFSYLPYIFISLRYEKMSLLDKLMACFLNNLAMSEGVQLIGMFEGKGTGINFNNWNSGVSVDDDFSLLQIMLMMVLDNIIHIVLLYYFEKVLPGQHGIAAPWNFPYKNLVGLFKSEKKEIEDDARQSLLGNESNGYGATNGGYDHLNESLPVYIEDESVYSSTRKIGVKIVNLFKKFKQLGKTKVAVNKLNLNIYQGQITVLLGHNGAGKSTTISMITGLCKPDDGNILINDIDVVKNTEQARSVLGYCPQHNLLFDDLTVYEHLEFFSKLKKNYNHDEIIGMLEMLNLSDKKNALSKTLSGGMKRKLSVAIAFIGGSNIVILDEPSSGMDPQARHSTWSLLQKFRKEKNCTILLTTHFMDEADILGDRIAIMSRGSLKCCGSPLYLKSKYGSGYNLVLTRQRRNKKSEKEEKDKTGGTNFAEQKSESAYSSASVSAVAAETNEPKEEAETDSSDEFDKQKEIETNKIIDLVQKFVPNARLSSNINTEISFVLPSEYSSKFPGLFEQLENNSSELNILNIGISVTTVEEIFLKIGENENVDDLDAAAALNGSAAGRKSFYQAPETIGRNNSTRAAAVNLQISNYLNDAETLNSALWVGSKASDRVYGLEYLKQQFKALFVKRLIHSLRNKALIISQILVPIGVIIINLVYLKYAPIKPEDSVSLNIDISKYSTNYLPIYVKNNSTMLDQLGELYKLGLKDYKNTKAFSIDDTTTESDCANVRNDIDLFLACLGRLNIYNLIDKYLAAVTFSHESKDRVSLVAHFNNQPYHVPALTLNTLTNSLFKYYTNSTENRITVINHPLPRDVRDQVQDLQLKDMTGFNVASGLTFGFSFLIASFAMFLIKERVSDSKHLQYMSGANSYIFWISSLIWDMLNYVIPVGIVVLMLKLFGVEEYVGDERSVYVLGLLLIYGLAHIPQMYLLSYTFKVSATGFATLTAWNILSSQATLTPTAILTLPQLGLQYVSDILEWVFMVIFPNFAVGQGLLDLYTNYQVLSICKNASQYCQYGLKSPCCKYYNASDPDPCGGMDCLDWNENYLGWQAPGLARFFTFMPLQFIVQFGIVLLFEAGLLRRVAYRIGQWFQSDKEFQAAREQQESMEELFGDIKKDNDVLAEEDRISSLTKNNRSLAIAQNKEIFIIDRLTKHYKRFMAVKGVSFSMEKSECFGLLGVNGAGKTTSFKMITGDEFITNGNAYLNGVSLKTDIKGFQQQLGYCPQFDPLIDQMTVLETMYMFARLRGIRPDLIRQTCLSLIDLLDLSDHTTKMCYTLSGGNKRKLSVAISLIGSPCVVLLDEPTSGMDPKTRRTLWNCLNNIRNKGKSLILTTHSMDETEALCTNIGIMVNGELKCLGSLQHLKSKYGEGYTLMVKIALSNSIGIINSDAAASSKASSAVHGNRLDLNGRTSSFNDDDRKKINDFINFVLTKIQNSELRENRDGYVNIHINNNSQNILSTIFSLIESNKQFYSIEHYFVTQTKLEQIFLNFASKQIDPESRLLQNNTTSHRKCCCC